MVTRSFVDADFLLVDPSAPCDAQQIKATLLPVQTGGKVSIRDEGAEITAEAKSIDFKGTQITATADTTGNVVVTVAEPSGSSIITKNNGLAIVTDTQAINFTGGGATVTKAGVQADVNVPQTVPTENIISTATFPDTMVNAGVPLNVDRVLSTLTFTTPSAGVYNLRVDVMQAIQASVGPNVALDDVHVRMVVDAVGYSKSHYVRAADYFGYAGVGYIEEYELNLTPDKNGRHGVYLNAGAHTVTLYGNFRCVNTIPTLPRMYQFFCELTLSKIGVSAV